MGRPTRVPYHQNVYDLLDLSGTECGDARRLADAHEAAHGPLPASVREWLLVPNVLPLTLPAAGWWTERAADRDSCLWYRYSNSDQVESVEQILAEYANPGRFARVLVENQGVCSWFVERTGADDPPVWTDVDRHESVDDWRKLTDTFSGFVWMWVRQFHGYRNHPTGWESLQPTGDPHALGAWACAPAAPFRRPVLDALADRVEPTVELLPSGAVRHTFALPDGTLRVTADHPDWPTPHAAWWAEADTPDRLAALLRPLQPFGVLTSDVRRPVADPHADPWAGL